MSIFDGLKGWARNQVWLYEWVRQRRASQWDRRYLNWREYYYRQAPEVFCPPGFAEHSRQRLRSGWKGPRRTKTYRKEVRLFWVTHSLIGAVLAHEELSREFDIVVFDYSPYWSPHGIVGQVFLGRDQLQQEILSAFESANRERSIDLAVFLGDSTPFDAKTLMTIREQGTPVCVLVCDQEHSFDHSKGLIPACDVYVTFLLESVRWVWAEGGVPYLMAPGADPQIYKPIACVKDIDVSFVGSGFGLRRAFIEALRQAGIRVEVFGAKWGPGIPIPTTTEMVKIINRSKINLGINNVMQSEKLSTFKGPDAYIPMSGNLYLARYAPHLARMYDIGREIACYLNEIDCVEQIRYYLDHPDEAKSIAVAGRRRALRDYTWTRCVDSLLEWMGILVFPEPQASSTTPIQHSQNE